MVALTYMPSYASEFLGIDLQSSLWATLIGAILTVVLPPVAGHISDKLGRKTLIEFSAVGTWCCRIRSSYSWSTTGRSRRW
ncbi:hypothetical protein OOK36_50805 [Streptomyces sp. NBC_00365]|nr:hypothetical protein [Streptomyces sp. NBC_00365]